MNDLILNIFNYYGYSYKKENDFYLYYNNNSNEKNYWVVIESEANKIIKRQADLITECKALILDIALVKNINILCLWRVDHESRDIRISAHKIEEDPYFFKKHVLYYSDAELIDLLTIISESGIENSLKKLMVSSDVFSQYKDNCKGGSWQALLYRLAIKLPIIKISNSDSINIRNLGKDIDMKFNALRKHKEITKSIEAMVLDDKFDITKSSDEIVDEIIKSLKENGHEI